MTRIDLRSKEAVEAVFEEDNLQIIKEIILKKLLSTKSITISEVEDIIFLQIQGDWSNSDLYLG